MNQNDNRSNNRRNKNNRNKRNKGNGQKRRTDDKEQQDKKVPMRYQIRNSKETNAVELKYTGIDGVVDKTKFSIFEDGYDEDYLKLIKEFQNYIDTYEIWNDEHAAYIVYKNFRRCLAGAARDLWDQIIVQENDDEEEESDGNDSDDNSNTSE